MTQGSSGASDGMTARFWDRFVAGDWGRRPAFFPRHFADSLTTPERLFESLVRASDRYRDGDRDVVLRFYVGQVGRADDVKEDDRSAPTARGRGMVIGMATAKLTITLDEAQLEEVRRLVAAGRAASVSGFVQHAVKVALHDAAGWQQMLAEALDATGGPLTKKERAWADRLLSPPRRRARRAGA